MILKFPYRKFPRDPNEVFSGKEQVKRPVIPIKVKYKNNEIDYLVLIDSGADFCIFHADIGDVLGISIKKGKKLEFFGIIGDKEEAFFHEVTINVGGYDKKLFCGFSYQFNKMPYGILGQKGFFDLFEIKMDYQKNRIELKERH